MRNMWNYKYCNCFLEYTNKNVCVVTKIINTSLMKSERNDFLSVQISNHRCLSLWIYGLREKWNIVTWKRRFFSHLNIEDITDADYEDAKRICNDLKIKDLGEYHDLHVPSDTLLLADTFENFKKYVCWNIWAWSIKISFSFRISLASYFKKN